MKTQYPKYQYFNGLKFTRDEKTGYYLNSTLRIRMHRYVWEFHNGKIPKGYHIHHIDGDKSNNDITNLAIVYGKSHVSNHSKVWHKEHTDESEKIIEKMQTEAKAWHKSGKGKDWHKENYERNIKPSLHPETIKSCMCCGEEYVSHSIKSKYCSGRCKTKAGRRIKDV